MSFRHYAKFVRRKYSIAAKKLLVYKINLIISACVLGVQIFLTILFWKVLFFNRNTLNGWTFQDSFGLIIFIYFFWIMYNIFESGTRIFFKSLRYGALDYAIIRPVPIILSAILHTIFPFYLLSNSLAFLFLLFFYFLTFHVSLLNFLSSLLFALFGSFIFLLFFFILYSLSFWFKQTTYMFFLVELKNIANKYPLTVSNKFFQFVFTFIFPLIFVVTIPAEILRGNFSFVWILYEIGMLIALALLAAFVWKKGLEHYESGMG